MIYIIPSESFPWDKTIQKFNITITKEKILEHSVKDYHLYKVNSSSKNDISYSFGYVNYITIIDSNNINKYLNKSLLNVYFYVDDENKLFHNFSKIYNNFYGWISFKLKPLKQYDLEILEQELNKIKVLYEKLFDHKIYIPINEFENYKFDIDHLYIKDNFDCIQNPYYYTKQNLLNLLSNVKYDVNDIKYSSEFMEKDKLFKKIINNIDINVDVIDYNMMVKTRKMYQDIYMINFERENGKNIH